MLTAIFFATAALFSSVGQAGASGYLAVMSFLGISPAVMRPTALALNVPVSAIAAYHFGRAGLIRWPLLWPFALGSIPLALVGGAIVLPGRAYDLLVALVLWLAGGLLLFREPQDTRSRPLTSWVALIVGASVGLLSGLTGTGGGIFLGPLMILAGWANARETSGVVAAFNLVNSLAGLAGQPASLATLPQGFPAWLVATILGGFLGSRFGSKQAQDTTLRRLLAVVLILAGARQAFR